MRRIFYLRNSKTRAVVAEGVEFTNSKVVLSWTTAPFGVVVHDDIAKIGELYPEASEIEIIDIGISLAPHD